MTFDGTDFLVVWDDGRANPFADIYAARVAPTGVVKDPAGVPISQNPTGQKFVPQVRCLGASCLIVWSDRDPSPDWYLNGRHVDANLTIAEPNDVPVMATATSRYLPRLSTGGGDYFLAWSDERVIGTFGTAGTRIDASGQSLDGDGGRLSPNVAAGTNFRPAVTWDGSSWWVAWMDSSVSPSIIELARVHRDGFVLPAPAGPLVELTALRDPELAFDGTYVWLAFGADRADAGSIVGMRYGLDGIPVDLPQALSTPTQWTGMPAMASDGQGRTLLVWLQSASDGGTELHHRLLLEGSSLDAGVDAGTDAGVDAGTDAGSGVDAGGGADGGGDAGAPDAGPLSPRTYQVACGCTAVPENEVLALAVLLAWVRRRRKRRE